MERSRTDLSATLQRQQAGARGQREANRSSKRKDGQDGLLPKGLHNHGK